MVRIQGKDSVPVPGARVVLHRVGRGAQGPVDSVAADRAGRFRFRFRADTSALYLLSARYADIEYFSAPVHTNPERPDTAIALVVSDTSTTAPVEVEARHLVVSRPGRDRTRGVLEIVILRNSGDRTRVARDSLTASFAMRIPRGAIGVQAGQGDFSSEAITVQADRVQLFAPIAPGEKQLVFSYTLPADLSRLTVPFEQPVATVNLLLEEFSSQVAAAGLVKADSQSIEGRWFQRWSGPVVAGTAATITFPGAGPIRWALPVLVSSLGLALAGVAWRLLRRAPARPPVPRSALTLDAIARLDARYLGREGEIGPEEWRHYQTERARLKAELSAHLAAGGPTP